MRLVEVARARADQVIHPCMTESFRSAWAELVNVTSDLEAKEIPVDFFTLFSIIACVVVVWIIILVIAVTCPLQLSRCAKEKHFMQSRRARKRYGHDIYEKRFLFVDTSGRTRVISKAAHENKNIYKSGSSTTSRSTTTSTASKSSSTSSQSHRRSPETQETSEDTLVPLYDLIEDDEKDASNERINGDSAEASCGGPKRNEFVRYLQPSWHYARCQKDPRKGKHASKLGQLDNNCQCQHDLLPLLRHKCCCAADENCRRMYSKGRDTRVGEKAERLNCENNPSNSSCLSNSIPLTNNDYSSHFDLTEGSGSRIYKLPSFSQSTIKNAESCDEDLLFNHSVSHTPSIDATPSSQSFWNKTRQPQLLQETFICSSRHGDFHPGSPKTPSVPHRPQCAASNNATLPPLASSTASSEIRGNFQTPINGTHLPKSERHQQGFPGNGHLVNGFRANCVGDLKSYLRDNRSAAVRTPDYVNENTCAPYRSYQFIELDERAGDFSHKEDVAMGLKPSDFFGLQCCSLPSHIRSRDRYQRESDLVYHVPQLGAATSRTSRTQRTSGSFGQRRSGFDMSKDGGGNFSSGGIVENAKLKDQEGLPLPPRRCSGSSQINSEAATSSKILSKKCRLRPGAPEDQVSPRGVYTERDKRNVKVISEQLPDTGSQREPVRRHSNAFDDDEYVDMSQPSMQYFTTSYHKSNTLRLPNNLY